VEQGAHRRPDEALPQCRRSGQLIRSNFCKSVSDVIYKLNLLWSNWS
jgi:hypothetical protein